jgi:four helix bundle protein
MKDYKKLQVWRKAHELVILIYKVTRKFPKEEKFNLISQMRRAATSSPTNISEGCGKYTQRDFANYLQTSQGSTQEVEYLVFLSYELGYLTENEFKQCDQKASEVKAMLISLITKIRKDLKGPNKF